MNEKPIIFKSEMVRAILDGRKTQTRRVVVGKKTRAPITINVPPCEFLKHSRSPYGAPGDLLWVRETWAVHKSHDNKKSSDLPKNNIIVYRADGVTYLNQGKWRPSIHMPRWASRITLRITDVRVERVQDISIDDIVAEGVFNASDKIGIGGQYAIGAFADSWDSINAKRGFGWNANPWVWVMEFEVVK